MANRKQTSTAATERLLNAARRAALEKILREREWTQKDWAAACVPPVSAAHVSNLINHGLKTSKKSDVLERMLVAAEVTVDEFKKRVEAEMREKPAIGFRGVYLPSMLVPTAPDGFLLQFASQYFQVTRATLGLGKGDPVRMFMLARSLECLRENLAGGLSLDLREHALACTPFTYIGLSFALDQSKEERGRGGVDLLVLKDFAMELSPATFSLVARSEDGLEVPTRLSRFHDDVAKGDVDQAMKALHAKLAGRRVLYDSEVAQSFLTKLGKSFAEHKLSANPFIEHIKVNDVSNAMNLLAKGVLQKDCVVVAWHSHIWAIRRDQRSMMNLLVTNEPDAPRTLFDILPYRVVVVPAKLVDEDALDMAARWFVEMAKCLIANWAALFNQIHGFLDGEMHKFGVPGHEYTRGALREMIHEGLHLHVPSEPKFVPLNDDYVKGIRERLSAADKNRQFAGGTRTAGAHDVSSVARSAAAE